MTPAAPISRSINFAIRDSSSDPSSTEAIHLPRSNDDDSKSKSSSDISHYYIFIGLFVLVCCVSLWLVHIRRRRRNLALLRRGGQSALERDIDGLPYPNNRRWAGARRGDRGFLTTRRDEGLDEQGEAPPPYKPSGPSQTPHQELTEAHSNNESPMSSLRVLEIPLQTYDPTVPQPKPPGYYDTGDPSHELQRSVNEGQSSSDPYSRQQA